ncbi:MAG: YraN family protein [Betaproteobacteria bacterium]|nr:YraN family protein [Betaproteobacteria bacterium]
MKIAALFGRKQRGDRAEHLAEKFLRKQGMKTIERNYRTRQGEVDLIMKDGAGFVFVEVRLRSSQDYGGAAASIGHSKQQRIIAAAQHYLSGRVALPPCRFDVILLNQLDADAIEWIKDAFGA